MEPKAAPEGGAVSATDPDSPSGDSNAHGGDLLADAICRLANQAYVNPPALLARDYGLEFDEPLRRDRLTDAEGRDLQVNILGRSRRRGEPLWVIGECKA